MKKKEAKRLRKLAEQMTNGKPEQVTRKRYRQLKAVHKSLPKNERIK